jgi:hypothetical protein
MRCTLLSVARFFVLPAFLFVGATSAKADSMTLYDYQYSLGTVGDFPGPALGTVTYTLGAQLDPSLCDYGADCYAVNALSLSLNSPLAGSTFTATLSSSDTGDGGVGDPVQLDVFDGFFHYDVLDYVTNNESAPNIALGPTEGPFGTYTLYDSNDNSVDFGIVAPSATPEPSSIALLGTGLLGAVGIGRRRCLRA